MKKSSPQSSLVSSDGSEVKSQTDVSKINKKKDPPRVIGKKRFTPPLDINNYETFIDHDCMLDQEGYPLYPNRNTVFVQLPGQKITNFGTVGFSKTIGVNYQRQQKWKVTQVYCLGALVCDVATCKWAGPPPTGKGKIEEYLELCIVFLRKD
jgi:hypothetical protein